MSEPIPSRRPPRFRRSMPPKLSPASTTRQNQVAHLAYHLLGGRDAAVDFLNNPNPALGGRPIDLAIASPEGAAIVERALRSLAVHGRSDH